MEKLLGFWVAKAGRRYSPAGRRMGFREPVPGKVMAASLTLVSGRILEPD